MLKNFSTLAMFIVFTTLPTSAYPSKNAPNSSDEFTSLMSSSRNWKQLLAKLDNSVSPFFLEEISKLAESSEFPIIRTSRGNVRIQNENGEHIDVRFEQGGSTFLNDRVYEIHPLAPILSEIERIKSISSIKNSSNSIFSFLISNAFAQPNSNGVAVAAFAAATGWHAKECGNASLSESQNRSCPLTAAAMVLPGPNAAKIKFRPIELVCPKSESNGTLDLISKNKNGYTTRLRVTYSNFEPKTVEVYLGSPGGPLKKLSHVTIATERDPTEIEMANNAVIQVNVIKTSVCEGPAEERKRYLAALAKNKSEFIRAQSEDQNGDDLSGGNTKQAI